MKTFKEYLSEHSGSFKRQWMDQDTMPSAPHALEAGETASLIATTGGWVMLNYRGVVTT